MHLLGLFLAAAVITGFCSAQLENGTTPAVDFSQLPSCGLACLATTAPQGGCSLADFDCICKTQKVTDLTSTCVLQNCTASEAFVLVKAQADLCQYGNASRKHLLLVNSLTLGTLTKGVVALRIFLRLISQGNLFWDDWLILLAVGSDSVALYAILRMLSMGWGEHIWNINPANVRDLLFWYYMVLILYVVTNGIVKTSILAFYLRIFTVSTRFSVLCWVNLCFCVALIICFVLVIVFQCIPVSDAFLLSPRGKCIDFNAATWAYSGVNVFQDLIVIVLPVMQVYALKMSIRKKIGVIMIFVLGGFVIIASVIRLFTLPGFGRTSDPTWTNAPTSMWSAIELGFGLVCASIPGIYSGLRHVWPAFRAFTRKHISMRGSRPTDELEKHDQNKELGISGVRRKGKYQKASLDLFATDNMEMEYKSNRNSMDKSPVDLRLAKARKVPDLNKPHPPLPREILIERSNHITVLRGPRSG